mmetsp:Transcript_60395/g.187519  ORF Transcript_60395/g.187519 Transcript_60395/m.187519 type:complete len:415 (-) Transcript_60395:104-1348(-)
MQALPSLLKSTEACLLEICWELAMMTLQVVARPTRFRMSGSSWNSSAPFLKTAYASSLTSGAQGGGVSALGSGSLMPSSASCAALAASRGISSRSLLSWPGKPATRPARSCSSARTLPRASWTARCSWASSACARASSRRSALRRSRSEAWRSSLSRASRCCCAKSRSSARQRAISSSCSRWLRWKSARKRAFSCSACLRSSRSTSWRCSRPRQSSPSACSRSTAWRSAESSRPRPSERSACAALSRCAALSSCSARRSSSAWAALAASSWRCTRPSACCAAAPACSCSSACTRCHWRCCSSCTALMRCRMRSCTWATLSAVPQSPLLHVMGVVSWLLAGEATCRWFGPGPGGSGGAPLWSMLAGPSETSPPKCASWKPRELLALPKGVSGGSLSPRPRRASAFRAICSRRAWP